MAHSKTTTDVDTLVSLPSLDLDKDENSAKEKDGTSLGSGLFSTRSHIRHLLSSEDPDSADLYPLFSRLPELHSLPAVNSPSLVTFGEGHFEGKWLLLLTSGNKRKSASKSLLEIWQKIDLFYELNCLVFVLSTDNWANLVRFRCRKVLEHGLGGRLDINLLSLQRTSQNEYDLRKLGILNEDEEAPNGWKFCYPAYMLYCPDKTLVERVVLKDEGLEAVTCTVKQEPPPKSEKKSLGSAMLADSALPKDANIKFTLLDWPITEDNVERILTIVEMLAPIYELARGCGATFQEFFESTDNVQESGKIDKNTAKNKKLRKLLKEVLLDLSK